MPFPAVTLLCVLTSDRVECEWRNGWPANGLLAVCALLFPALAVQQLIKLLSWRRRPTATPGDASRGRRPSPRRRRAR